MRRGGDAKQSITRFRLINPDLSLFTLRTPNPLSLSLLMVEWRLLFTRPIKENECSFAAVVQDRVHAMVRQLCDYRDTSHERMHKLQKSN